MELSKNFTLNELIKSQEATRLGIDNTPNEEQIKNLKILCEKILQPLRDYYGMPLSISSGYRSAVLCEAIGSSAVPKMKLKPGKKVSSCPMEFPLAITNLTKTATQFLFCKA